MKDMFDFAEEFVRCTARKDAFGAIVETTAGRKFAILLPAGMERCKRCGVSTGLPAPQPWRVTGSDDGPAWLRGKHEECEMAGKEAIKSIEYL